MAGPRRVPPSRWFVFALMALAACTNAGGGAVAAVIPPAGHVFIVVEENTNYSSVVGTGAMPYLDTLIAQGGLATEYYANTHPSIGNYFMMTVGAITTNEDGYADTVRADNVVRRLVTAGKRWKSYAEDLPSVGYVGDGPAPYARRHNPLSYFADVIDDTTQRKNLVPLSQLTTDIAAGTLPGYGFIVPNLCSDAHDCPVGTADAWLRANIAPLLASNPFRTDGLLIVLFDESASDNNHGGGRIAWVLVGARVKPGYRSSALYQHESTLRLSLQALGLTGFPGAAATAPDMSEFFRN